MRNVSKIRDQVGKQARRLGTRSPGGKNAQAVLDGLGKVVDSLELMKKAGAEGSKELRDKSNEVMREARAIMESVGP